MKPRPIQKPIDDFIIDATTSTSAIIEKSQPIRDAAYFIDFEASVKGRNEPESEEEDGEMDQSVCLFDDKEEEQEPEDVKLEKNDEERNTTYEFIETQPYQPQEDIFQSTFEAS